MGSALSCGVCPTAATSSVINLSDALMLRMENGIEVKNPNELEQTEDSDWIAKLKCLDDAHTNAYGLTYRKIDLLIQALEERTRSNMQKNACPENLIVGCYRFNPDCTLRCAGEVGDYIDCVDTKRLQKLKVKMDEAKKKNMDTKIK